MTSRIIPNSYGHERTLVSVWQQELSTPEEAAVGAGAAEELDRVKAEYFGLRQELEALRDGLRSRDSQLAEAERRAQDAENWIQIKDSMIEKQRNLLKEMDASKTVNKRCGGNAPAPF